MSSNMEPAAAVRRVREHQSDTISPITYVEQVQLSAQPYPGPVFSDWDRVVPRQNEKAAVLFRDLADAFGWAKDKRIVDNDFDVQDSSIADPLIRQYSSGCGLFELAVQKGIDGKKIPVFLAWSTNARGHARHHAMALKQRMGKADVEVYYRFDVQEAEREKRTILLHRYDYMLNGPNENNAYRLNDFMNVTGVDLTEPEISRAESSDEDKSKAAGSVSEVLGAVSIVLLVAVAIYKLAFK